MAEYIDRVAFISHEESLYCKDCNHRKNSKGKMVYAIGDAPCGACRIMDVLGDLEDHPAADVVERKTGKWALVEKRRKASVYRCSKCGNFFTVWPDTLNCGRGDMNYCPNCGAA